MSITYHYHYWPPQADWKINDDGMVAQSVDELEAGSLPIFTQLAKEINNSIRAKQAEAGLAVSPKWLPPAA